MHVSSSFRYYLIASRIVLWQVHMGAAGHPLNIIAVHKRWGRRGTDGCPAL